MFGNIEGSRCRHIPICRATHSCKFLSALCFLEMFSLEFGFLLRFTYQKSLPVADSLFNEFPSFYQIEVSLLLYPLSPQFFPENFFKTTIDRFCTVDRVRQLFLTQNFLKNILQPARTSGSKTATDLCPRKRPIGYEAQGVDAPCEPSQRDSAEGQKLHTRVGWQYQEKWVTYVIILIHLFMTVPFSNGYWFFKK